MSNKPSVDRRNFLKQAAVTGAAAALVPASGRAGAVPQDPAPTRATAPIPPREVDPPRRVEIETIDRPGGDFMVDVLKALNLEYVASNPGSSFRGIHESIINYGSNTYPEFITCCHEESSVAMAHGYFKAEGKPMAVLCHGTVGLQHAAMAIYNAYCDRVPVYILAGNSLDATLRRPGVEWAHSVQDAAAMGLPMIGPFVELRLQARRALGHHHDLIEDLEALVAENDDWKLRQQLIEAHLRIGAHIGRRACSQRDVNGVRRVRQRERDRDV